MSAQPAHKFFDVIYPWSAEAAGLFRDERGETHMLPVSDMKKTDLLRFAKLVSDRHPEDMRPNGRTLNLGAHGADLESVRSWLTRGEAFCPLAWRTPATSEPVPPTPVTPTATPTATDTPQEESEVAAAARRLAEALAKTEGQGTVSTEQVDALVGAKLASVLPGVVTAAVAREVTDAMRPKEIHLPDREPVTVEGRQHKLFERVLLRAQMRVPVLLVGPPGTGKTHMAEEVAKHLGLSFGMLPMTPQTPVSAIQGYRDANGVVRDTPFVEAYTSGGGFLFDEMDNAHPASAAVANAALAAHRGCNFAGGFVRKHEDFWGVAAANTFGTGPTSEFAGRSKMDAATLDRFAIIYVDTDEGLESHLAAAYGDVGDEWCATVQAVRANVAKYGLKVFVTPRATLGGAKLLKAGAPRGEVVEEFLKRGNTPATWSKMVEGTNLS